MFKLVLENSGEPEIKLPISDGSSKKQEEFQKNIYFCFIDYAKAFYYVDHNKLWKILKEMGIPDHLTCLLRNLYADQEAGQAVWYSHLFKSFPQVVVTYTVEGFGIVNKGEVDIFLQLSCFFYDSTDVGNFDLWFLCLC